MPRRPLVLSVLALTAAALLAVPSASVQAVPPTVHFTAAGDYSAGSNASLVLNAIGAAKPDVHLALGDLSYGTTGAEQAWCDFVTARVGAGFPFELISGNHESNGTNGNINDFAACLPNQLPGVVGTYGRQWYADYPKGDPTVRFVMISPGITFPDGTWSYAAGTARYQWTAAAIDGARAAGIPWVVVGMHKPCLSVGEYTCESGQALNDLLLQRKVDLVLAGHEHLYQRSKQLALATGCAGLATGTYDADCVVDSDDQLSKGAGTVYVTSGTGGVVLRDIDTSDTEAPYFAKLMGANSGASYGYFDVVADADQLSGHFVPVTGSSGDTFTISRGAAVNSPPTAVIATPSCTGLTCGFASTGSADPDGAIAGYAWTFGDGATSATASATHAYAAAGTYPVTLTLTDDDGATSTASASVTVSATAPPFAADTFTRTLSSGWGTAETGGAWTVGPVAQGSVTGGVGQLRMPTAGAGPGAYLAGASSSSTDLTATVSVDKTATGSGTYMWIRGRRVAGAGDYRTKLWWQTGNALRISLSRTDAAGAETAIGSSVLLSGGVTAGDQLRVRMQATGTGPTTLRAKVWRLGQTEPSSWTVSATDSTAALQVGGYVGLTTYLSTSATNAPVTVSIDDWRAAAP
jgi:PKD repeat protein